ncbi:helix-turn-helix domain-containing protein [Microbulbifer sp. TRSA005]|uniref:helix-turn-helix domain-containing protein n=1 Tax=Microbulbifer sp. TRSA005 TaxID=3243383 RepID=UPI0040395BCD
MANKLDIRYSHLNKYESGMHAPPQEKLIQLADIFEVSLDYLVMGQPMEESPIRNEVLFKRFKLLETFDDQDKDTMIRVIIAQRQVEHAMRPLER